jgi:hypothetical protein
VHALSSIIKRAKLSQQIKLLSNKQSSSCSSKEALVGAVSFFVVVIKMMMQY